MSIETARRQWVASRAAQRWAIHYVRTTGEFLVWDRTARCLRGQAVVCADDAAVLRFITNALADERRRIHR